MKTLFIAMIILLTTNLSSDELAWVDEQVEAIKPPRTGMKSRELSVLKDPFIFLKKNRIDENKDKKKNSTRRARSTSVPNKTTASSNTKKVIKKKRTLSVTMLMNSSAFINEKWYKVGDKVRGYKVSKIDSSSVLLTKNKKKLLLSTNSKNKNLNFNNK